MSDWAVGDVRLFDERVFFGEDKYSKDSICNRIRLTGSLYTPGWFYQQMLKLGAGQHIEGLSDNYMVWDSDLLPVDPWPILTVSGEHQTSLFHFAILQHEQYGNPEIVSKWESWIKGVLGIHPAMPNYGTPVSHHMWFNKSELTSLLNKISDSFDRSHWIDAMVKSIEIFGTFSEFMIYYAWLKSRPLSEKIMTEWPYQNYGETTERFFDDGSSRFSKALSEFHGKNLEIPSFDEVFSFISDFYPSAGMRYPSSLSFEQSPRHLKKEMRFLHIEESRSMWNVRSKAQ